MGQMLDDSLFLTQKNTPERLSSGAEGADIIIVSTLFIDY